MRKWEAEERYREFEIKKWEAERQESTRRLEAEREDRKAEMILKEAEFELNKKEAAKQDTSVGNNKVFSDVMRSSAICMSDDPIEAVAFFMNVEQLFDVYKVPTDLKALLIRPYVNDKVKSIVSKLTPDGAGDYSRLKDALLHEFKLSPITYLERFNSCRKSCAETFVSFPSRLKGLLNYYLDSRYVTYFAKLCELLVCDRIKSTLSDSCLQYALSIERGMKDGWMPMEELTSSIDSTYCKQLSDNVLLIRSQTNNSHSLAKSVAYLLSK